MCSRSIFEFFIYLFLFLSVYCQWILDRLPSGCQELCRCNCGSEVRDNEFAFCCVFYGLCELSLPSPVPRRHLTQSQSPRYDRVCSYLWRPGTLCLFVCSYLFLFVCLFVCLCACFIFLIHVYLSLDLF